MEKEIYEDLFKNLNLQLVISMKLDDIGLIAITKKQLKQTIKYYKKTQTQLKKQQEINKKAIEYINNNLMLSSILDGKKYYSLNDYGFDYKKLLQILEDKGE